MYLPRSQISQLYTLLIRNTHPSSSPVLLLTALTVDSLCATRILTNLLKRDFIPHTIIPVSGYADLQNAGAELILPLTRQRGGDGGTVVCLGLGGAVALEEVLGLDGRNVDADVPESMEEHGVEVWVIDSHRPWNLENVFRTSASAVAEDGSLAGRLGVTQGRLSPGYKPGRGGIIVWDDDPLDAELQAEKEAYFALQGMPEITEDDLVLADSEDDADDAEQQDALEEDASSKKRKRDVASDDEEDEDESSSESSRSRARRRRRSSNCSSSLPIPSSPGGNPLSGQLNITSTPPTLPSSAKEPSAKQMRRQLLKLRRKHEATMDKYYDLGTSAGEPVSSMMYSLASELGREDNELLWLAIVGISAVRLAPFGAGQRTDQIHELLQDEVRRLNPIPESELARSQSAEAIIPTTARGPADCSIRLSPEPRFLLVRHWSLYDSMRHSPYLATRLHLWTDSGLKRLHKLLAKMGVSLQEAGKGYLHMDSELKRTLRKRILKFAEQYNLEGLVPGESNGRGGKEGWGFVRHWGWQGTLSAEDVAIVVGAILEVGTDSHLFPSLRFDRSTSTNSSYNTRMRNLPTPPHSSDDGMDDGLTARDNLPDFVTQRFFRAYDSLAPVKGLDTLKHSIPSAQSLYKAILRVGTHIIGKKLVRHLRAFRMAVVREGPDLQLFTHPGALVRLASWVGEAIAVQEAEKGRKIRAGKDDALVLGALDEGRGVYVVVGLGGGNGWHGTGKKFRTKAEIKEREEKKKRKEAERIARKANEKRKREERQRLRRERMEANGLLDSDADDDESEQETETNPSDSEDDSDDDHDDVAGDRTHPRGKNGPLNRFGQAFQQVVEETGARVRIDSFEHCVVEVKKEDLPGFLEALSLKPVVS